MSDAPPPPGGYTAKPPPTQSPSQGKAVAALVLGIVGLIAWFCPLVGLTIGIVGIVLAVLANNKRKTGMATAGLVLCIIGVVLSAINMAIGIYLGIAGQHPLLQ